MSHPEQAIQDRNVALLVNAADEEEHAEWLVKALSRPVANPDALVDFLAGSTRSGHTLNPSYYGCMQQFHQARPLEDRSDCKLSHEFTSACMRAPFVIQASPSNNCLCFHLLQPVMSRHLHRGMNILAEPTARD